MTPAAPTAPTARLSLRRRLVVAVAALVVVLTVAGAGVVTAQRTYLVDRMDEDLLALARSPRAVLLASRNPAGPVTEALLGEVYVGRTDRRGRLVTVLAPASDPTLVPRLAVGESIPEPAGRTTLSGESHRVRVVTAPLAGGGQAVLAMPLAPALRSVRRLAVSLLLTGAVVAVVLGLLVWWVDRLGLRPIAAMTAAADAVRRGETSRRVPPGPPGSEAARLGEALNAMIDAAGAANERMRRLLADVSHELRTPLTTLQGYTGLHAARSPGPLDAAQRAEVDDAMRRVGDEASRMRRLVDGLLDLAGLEETGLTRRVPVDLAPLLADVASDLRVVAPDRQVRLSVPPSLVVPGDPDRITQAVVALTANAVRHTPAATPLALNAFAEGDRVRVEVVDAGPGIPAEHLPHVFERFHRVDRSRSAGRGGSGLGLAIVAAIARAHGGTAEVASAPGRGSTFSVLLPAGG